MNYCSRCRKLIDNKMMYCSYCGVSLMQDIREKKNHLYYHLPYTSKRYCDIKVLSNRVVFEGKFWYLRDKEFYRNKKIKDVALIADFLGMGYLKKRSYKKSVAFVVAGLILEVINTIIDTLSEWINKTNFFLHWMGKTIALPEWIDITMNSAVIICIILGIFQFFSRKKVVEVSFIGKRICIPEKSISDTEFAELYQTIKLLSENG